jgi:acyl dehydratase
MTDHDNVWPRGAPNLGQKAELSRQVSEQDIGLFTAISGNRNPVHYDEELASAILNAVVAKELPGPWRVFLHVDWNFKAPVRPGDRITDSVEVVKVRTDKPIAERKTTVTCDDGTVALEGEALCYTMPLRRPEQ